MSSKQEFLHELVKANGLDEGEDIYQLTKGGKKTPIITRTGIEKIQYNNSIKVTFDWISMSKDYACIKATATKGDLVIETYGSAWHGQGGNCMSNYVAEMAEKRGLARVVLKVVGAGKYGVYGKDESDDF
jgi:hypothetical protein